MSFLRNLELLGGEQQPYIKRKMSWPEWAKCSVCWEDDLNPLKFYEGHKLVLLPCCHVLCEGDCFESVCGNEYDHPGEESWQAACITCSTKLTITKESSKSMLIDPFEFVVPDHKRQLCTLCIRQGYASEYCKQCDQYMCMICSEHHCFSQKTRGHETIEINPELEQITEASLTCEQHDNKPYLAYCGRHDQHLCQDCIPVHCSCKKLRDLKRAMENVKKDVGGFRTDIKELVSSCEKQQCEIQDKIKELSTTVKEELEEEARFQLSILLSQLFARENELRSEIKTIIEETARLLRLKNSECNRKSQSVLQYQELLKSLSWRAQKSDFVAGEEWLKCYRFVKSAHASQMKSMEKYNSSYFELDKNLKMNKGAYITVGKGISDICTISYSSAKRSPQRKVKLDGAEANEKLIRDFLKMQGTEAMGSCSSSEAVAMGSCSSSEAVSILTTKTKTQMCTNALNDINLHYSSNNSSLPAQSNPDAHTSSDPTRFGVKPRLYPHVHHPVHLEYSGNAQLSIEVVEDDEDNGDQEDDGEDIKTEISQFAEPMRPLNSEYVEILDVYVDTDEGREKLRQFIEKNTLYGRGNMDISDASENESVHGEVDGREEITSKISIVPLADLADWTPTPIKTEIEIVPPRLTNECAVGMRNNIATNLDSKSELFSIIKTELKPTLIGMTKAEKPQKRSRKTKIVDRSVDQEICFVDESELKNIIPNGELHTTASTSRCVKKSGSLKTHRNTVLPIVSPTSRLPGKREIKRKLDPEFVSSSLISVKKSKQSEKTAKEKFRKNTSFCTSTTLDESDHEDYCAVCRDGGDLICCDGCAKVFHPGCHIPALSGIPDGSFYCNCCRTQADGIDPQKQCQMHIRNPEVDGIHTNPVEFFKACKFLSEIFRLENELEFFELTRALRWELLSNDESNLLKLHKRLTVNDPTPLKCAEEMLCTLEYTFQQYWHVVKTLKISNVAGRPSAKMKKFDTRFYSLLGEYYPNFARTVPRK